MSKRSSKSRQRAFPWREPLLAALRRNPKMVLACKAANISRNTAYTHLRKDARFRRRWEHALDQGFDEVYRLHLKQLAVNPDYQRAMQRVREALGWWRERERDVTRLMQLAVPTPARACEEPASQRDLTSDSHF